MEKHALLCGYTVERLVHDYGIDFWIATYDREGIVESGEIRVQLKATDHLKVIDDGRFVALRVDRGDLAYWLDQTMPVILVLYDARADMAYWLYIQAYWASEAGLTLTKTGRRVTVHIPTANVVNSMAIRKFAEYRDNVLTQTKGVAHRG